MTPMARRLPSTGMEVIPMNSAAMVSKCFRHQHPEAYGELEITEPPLPINLRYGHDRTPAPTRDCFAEEALGFPGARPLDD
jgi:hypothetical protein